MSDHSVRFKLAALASWRESVVNSGRDPSALPSDADLVTIAQSTAVSRAALSELDFESPSAVVSYSPGILGALRAALADGSAPGALPDLPVGLSALLSAEAGSTDELSTDSSAAPVSSGASPIAASLLGHLIEWRDGVISSARDGRSLPTDRDLVEIARCGVPKRAAIEGLELDRPAAAKEFGMGIVAAMRRALAAAESGSDHPPVESLPRTEERPPAGGEPVATEQSCEAGDGRPRRSGGRTGLAEIQPEEFARYEPVEQRPAAPATCVRRSDGVEISWLPPKSDVYQVYRVVSADGYKPFSPDEELLAATSDPIAVDSRSMLTAVRYYAIWVNEGSDEAKARDTQPRMLAEGYIVASPTGVVIAQDHGTVFGRWDVAEGIQRVEVQRIPARLAESGTYLSQYSVAHTSANLKGFSDPSCPPGSDVVYRVFAVTESDEGDLLISPPVSQLVEPPGVIPLMGEIEAVANADRTAVDLSWAQSVPADVRIYRTDQPPAVGAQRRIPVSSMEEVFGAPAGDKEVKLSPEWTDGTATLAGIPWPPGWTRVYFTAVAVDRETADVGPTATLARSGQITDAVVHQRVTWQQLTFNWPMGADEVRVYATPPGMRQMDDSAGDPIHIVTFDQHRDLGAIRFSGRGSCLPKEGCALHLMPITYNVEGAVRGGPALVAYKGLLRLKYKIDDDQPPEPHGRRGLRAGPAESSPTAVVKIATDWQPPDLEIELTMVANPDRLPLFVRDGTQVASSRVFAPGHDWLTVFDFPRARHRNSLVRLFATNSGVTLDIAVLDPALGLLRV